MIELSKVNEKTQNPYNYGIGDSFGKNAKQKTEYNIQSESKSTIKSATDTLSLSGDKLSNQELSEVNQLKLIDTKVRAHEQAHLAAGSGLVRGGASFQYSKGPDGKQYAVAGEVQIDASPVPDDPEATIQKMQQVRRAALAPSDPSPQDRKVASSATQIETSAAMELSLQKFSNKTEAFTNPFTSVYSINSTYQPSDPKIFNQFA